MARRCDWCTSDIRRGRKFVRLTVAVVSDLRTRSGLWTGAPMGHVDLCMTCVRRLPNTLPSAVRKLVTKRRRRAAHEKKPRQQRAIRVRAEGKEGSAHV